MNNKCIYAVGIMAALSGCADNDMVQMNMTQPESVVARDYLRSYDVLKSYAPQVGVNISLDALKDNGMERRIAMENFSEIVPADVFCHKSMVKANGAIDATNVNTVKDIVSKYGVQLVGGPLVWHSRQNVAYLNSLLAPNVNRPDGDDGGYCIKFTNSAMGENVMDAQVAYTFAKTPQVEPGIKYKLRMMIRGTAEGAVQCATYANGKGSRFNPVIDVTTEWTKVELTNTMAAGIKGLTSILFHVGQYVGTLYVDDIELFEIDDKGNEVTSNLNTVNTNLDDSETTAKCIVVQSDANSGLEEVGVSALGEGYDPLATYTEKTGEEKRQICTSEMERFIGGAMEAGGDATRDWIVIQDPFSDGTEESSAFLWQDYIGNGYAAAAFKCAANARSDARLFIGDNDITNASQLVTLASQIESAGARVDGFAIYISDDITATDFDYYAQSFSVLASTGKLVKIANLKVSVVYDNEDAEEPSESEESLIRRQASVYASILKAYTDNVPVVQRAGVIQHQVLDTNLPLGLWDSSYNRKHTYASFADGISK